MKPFRRICSASSVVRCPPRLEGVDAPRFDSRGIAFRQLLVQEREARERRHRTDAVCRGDLSEASLVVQPGDVVQPALEDRLAVQHRDDSCAPVPVEIRQHFVSEVHVNFVRRQVDVGEDRALQHGLLEHLAAPPRQFAGVEHLAQLIAELLEDADRVSIVSP